MAVSATGITAYFVGDTVAVAHVRTWTFAGTWENNDIVIVTIGTRSISTVTGSTVVATLLATIAAALNASTYPEFAEITWSASSTQLIATQDYTGGTIEATVTSTETAAGTPDSQTIDGVSGATLAATGSTGVDSTAAAGPNIGNIASNWLRNSLRALPQDGDDVVFMDCDVDILYGLDMSSITPNSIRRYQSFTGRIGPARVHESTTGSGNYLEFRNLEFKWGNTGDGGPAYNVYLGEGPGGGPNGGERWNFGTGQAIVNVQGTGTTDDDLEACLIVGTHASNAININKGNVGIAVLPGAAATVDVLKIGYIDNKDSDVTFRVGPGVTLNTVVKNGGTGQINCPIVTSFTNNGGDAQINGAGAVASLAIFDGTVDYNTTGTLGGTPVVASPGVLDFSNDQRIKTVTNPIEVYGPDPRKCVIDPFQVVTGLVIDWNEVSDDEVPLGANIRLTRSAAGTPAGDTIDGGP